MIRILIPEHTFHQDRITLVERFTKCQIRNFKNVKRAYYYQEMINCLFFEAFLENETKIQFIADCLADNPHLIKQEEQWDETYATWVIEDGDALSEEFSS